MKALLIRKCRDGNTELVPVVILHGPNKNGLISYQLLDNNDKPKPYIGGTCRMDDIQHGKLLWSKWPSNYLKGNS